MDFVHALEHEVGARHRLGGCEQLGVRVEPEWRSDGREVPLQRRAYGKGDEIRTWLVTAAGGMKRAA